MAREVDAAIESLKRDAQRQVAARRKAGKPRRVQRVPEDEQIRRFVMGEERARLERGEVTPGQYAQYRTAMLDKLRRRGALDG